MSKREREEERPDETPVTVIDLQATIQYNRPTFVTFANANSNKFQCGIIYSIFSCLVSRNSEFLAVPPIFLILGDGKIFFRLRQTVDQLYATDTHDMSYGPLCGILSLSAKPELHNLSQCGEIIDFC